MNNTQICPGIGFRLKVDCNGPLKKAAVTENLTPLNRATYNNVGISGRYVRAIPDEPTTCVDSKLPIQVKYSNKIPNISFHVRILILTVFGQCKFY